MQRRTVFAGIAGMAAVGLPGWQRVLAQGGTPTAAMPAGLPELVVTITDQSYEVAPATVPAGLVLLTVKNATQGELGAAVIGPPPGQSLDDFMAAAQASPTPQDQMPGFLFQATIPGGPASVPPGQSRQAIVSLGAGEWAIFGEGNQPPTRLTATGGTPAAQAEPTAAATVTEQEFAFVGLDGALPAGPQLWKVVNAGKQPHMLIIGKVPAATTMTQVMEAVNRPEGATPAAGALRDEDADFSFGGVLLQSGGQTVWPSLDLRPGRYVALCFVPDPATGQPHAMEGMVALFDVGGGAATPTG